LNDHAPLITAALDIGVLRLKLTIVRNLLFS